MMKPMISLCPLLLALAVPTVSCSTPTPARSANTASIKPGGGPDVGHALTLRVEGVRSSSGQIRAELLGRTSPDAKPVTITYGVADARQGVTTLTFPGLAAGDYAVQLFHDENGNGKVELNLAGVPVEGFAFSNTPQVQGGIPPFDQMKITVAADTATLAVLAYAP